MSAIAARRARLAAVSSTSSSPLPSHLSSDGEATNDDSRQKVTGADAEKRRISINDVFGETSKRRREDDGDERSELIVPGGDSDAPQTHRSDDYGDDRDGHGNELASAALDVQSTYVPCSTDGACNFWHSKDDDGTSSSEVICALEKRQTMVLIGLGSVEVLSGVISLNGATLKKQHREAFVIAPANTSLPVAQATSDSVDDVKLLKKYNFTLEKEYVAVVRLRGDRMSNAQSLHRVCPTIARNAFSVKEYVHPAWPLAGFGCVFGTSRSLARSCIPHSWSMCIEQLANLQADGRPIACLVRGPKRVGKSTLSKTILHSFLTHDTRPTSVAFLECDLGQSDFGLPGTVALHLFNTAVNTFRSSSPLVLGPSWATIRHPVKSHFVGEVSPKNRPAAYMNAIADLLHVYRSRGHSERIPLIVNTQGWVKGLGADLLVQLEEMICPTHIFDLSEDADNVSFTPTSFANHGEWAQKERTSITIVEASPSFLTRDRGLNAVESRSMNLTSYFYAVDLPCSSDFSSSSGSKTAPDEQLSDTPRWDFECPLVARTPFVVAVKTGLQGGVHFADSTCSIPDHQRLTVLNGTCVALVLAQISSERSDELEQDVWRSTFHTAAPELRTSSCVGMAIVRSIDPDHGTLHLLTPLAPEVLRQMQTGCLSGTSTGLALVQGDVELPIWLSFDIPILEAVRESNAAWSGPTSLADVPLSRVPYLDFGAENDEASLGMRKRRVRRNLLRASQHGSAS